MIIDLRLSLYVYTTISMVQSSKNLFFKLRRELKEQLGRRITQVAAPRLAADLDERPDAKI